MIPWPSLPLEPGMYGGAPQTQTGELVSSYSFGLNKSLDGVFTSYYATSLMIPNIQEPLNCRRLRELMDFICAYNHTFASFIEIGHYNNSRREASPSRRNRIRYRLRHVSARKLLSNHVSSTKRNRRRQVWLQEKRAVRIRTATTRVAVTVGVALFGLICATAGLVLWCIGNKNSQDEKLFQQVELCPSGPRRYGRRELAAATSGFAEEGKIGRGGFGPVYRGFLTDQERDVAIKVMSQGSSAQEQGMREFQAEVKVMTRLRHRNIVQLLGWCDGLGDLMLVYEFLPNGSLDKHLYHPQRLLTWSDRYLNTDLMDPSHSFIFLAKKKVIQLYLIHFPIAIRLECMQVQDCSGFGLGHTIPTHGVRAVRVARGHQAYQHLARPFLQRQARGLRLGEARRPRHRLVYNPDRGRDARLHGSRVRQQPEALCGIRHLQLRCCPSGDRLRQAADRTIKRNSGAAELGP
ncbi:unnamed protein product [Urochloa humidicola]